MALHGDLETFPLPDVLRLLASTAKSGRLDVSGADAHGEVWFVEGGVTGGRVSTAMYATAPADVVYELQRFDNGAFEFDASAEIDGSQARVAVDVVLADAETMLEEWRDVTTVVPSLDVWASLVTELDGDEIAISAEQWRTVAGLRGGMSVRELADRFTMTELRALQAVRSLVDAGLVHVGDELARPDTDDTFAMSAVAGPGDWSDDGGFADPADDGLGHDGAPEMHDEVVDEGVQAVNSAIEAAVAAAFGSEAHAEQEPEVELEATLPNELPDQEPTEEPVSARDRLDAMAATYLAAGAVVIEADDQALLPEPLPGDGTSFESTYDESEPLGEIHAFGRHEIDHRRPEPLPQTGGPIPAPVSVPTVRDHLAAPDDAPADDQGAGEGGFGWRPERRAKRPDAVQSALANLSPAAAQAIAEVADKSGQGVKPGSADADGDGVDRGTLLRFLSSVKN